MSTFAEKAIQFHANLHFSTPLPKNVEVMNPYKDEKVREINRRFYEKFFNDGRKRIFLFGINPGRFGAGVTGIAFTDPIRLETQCGIPNPFVKKQELSSVFIYEMIEAYGGAEAFYRDAFLTALCPLGFVENGKNMNYYDDQSLLRSVEPFILETMKKQIDFGADRKIAVCIGEGENFKQFSRLNDQHGFFQKVQALPHPRSIMQYRLKQKAKYIKQYLETVHEFRIKN